MDESLSDLVGATEFLGIAARKLKEPSRDKRVTHSRIDYYIYRFKKADLEKYLNHCKTHSGTGSPYLSLVEAAEYLHLTERQLRDLCREKRITYCRVDYRTYRFKKEDLDEWFESRKMKRKTVYA